MRFIDPDGMFAGSPDGLDILTIRKAHQIAGTDPSSDIQAYSKGAGKAVSYQTAIASVLVGGPVGLILGVPTLGIKISKDIVRVSGSDQTKINQAADTPTGIMTQAVTAAFDGDIEKAGKVGDLVEAVATGAANIKIPKTTEDVVATVSSAVDIGKAAVKLLDGNENKVPVQDNQNKVQPPAPKLDKLEEKGITFN